MTATVETIQLLIRELAMDVATLCNSAMISSTSQKPKTTTTGTLIKNVLVRLGAICLAMHFNPVEIITKKMDINNKKYNENACKENESILKWTSFSDVSGIDKDTILPLVFTPSVAETDTEVMRMLMDSFVLISTDIHAFAQRRNWIDKYS